MKIVIDISEETYKATCNESMLPPNVENVISGIKNGTPLPKGHWIDKGKTDGYIKWYCSNCNMLVRNSQKPWYNYCPSCSADMKEEEKDFKPLKTLKSYLSEWEMDER